ncbi:MAG: rubrerythrin family protein [Oscillospiraceae bacterium]|nr:rubrerythrin family protein [Oscillospiraceae bacterium]
MPNAYENYHKGNVDFMESKTRENLMRAFAGESQARNRYTFAASAARKEKLEAVARVFEFTADQERAHAKVFYDLLLPSAGQNIAIDGNYPIDLSDKTLDLLKAARHNEYEEFEHDYAAFAEIAHREGFDLIGGQFQLIAQIEKTHGDRFGLLAELLEKGTLFGEDNHQEVWMCLNCGEIITASLAPQVCPVCRHGQGYYVRLDMAPYTAGK